MRVRTTIFRILGTIVVVVLALVVWLIVGIWPGRAHAMRFGEIELGTPISAVDKIMGRGPDCRYLIAPSEVRYYLSPQFAPSSVAGCSHQGTRLSRWDQLPTNTYEAIVVSISAQGRVEAKELTGEGALQALPDAHLPEGAATIGCCGARTASPQ